MVIETLLHLAHAGRLDATSLTRELKFVSFGCRKIVAVLVLETVDLGGPLHYIADEVFVHLLHIEARVLLQPFFALFSRRNEHALVSPALRDLPLCLTKVKLIKSLAETILFFLWTRIGGDRVAKAARAIIFVVFILLHSNQLFNLYTFCNL